MADTKPRNITPQLRRLTVSARELASLGWPHGAVGLLRRGLGHDVTNPNPVDVVLPARLDTASLRIQHLWPRELVRLGLALLVVSGMVVALVHGAGPADPPEETPAALASSPEPVLPIVAAAPESNSKSKARVKKKRTERRKKKRRGRRRRR
jgi:hypothetical protein